MQSVLKIRGALKNYDWGKPGHTSIVSQLQKAAFDDFAVEDIPYAEFWMGTHQSGPATIPALDDMKLLDWILEHPESLGNNITSSFSATKGLPFLFKVLSVNKSLSIQVHPNKQIAETLHSLFPNCYPDDNHKPEMAIALTGFEALCGFRPLSEIKEFVRAVPQLKQILGTEVSEAFLNSESGDGLKSAFTILMTCPPTIFQPRLSEIVYYFKMNKYENSLCTSIRELFLKIYDQYPGDIGCFCLFFLNYLNLKCGEAIYLAANVPHAYLYGDCIECMACSDNVVRAGLTPKFKDVQTLCDILSYDCKSSEENIFQYITDSTDPCLKIYNPPVKEFSIDKISIPENYGLYKLKILNSASILLFIKGQGTYKYENMENTFSMGTALFISSNSDVFINSSTEALAFRAYCNS